MFVYLYRNVEYVRWLLSIIVAIVFMLPYASYHHVEFAESIIETYLNLPFLSAFHTVFFQQSIFILVGLLFGIAFFLMLVFNQLIERKNYIGLFFAILCYSAWQPLYFSVADVIAVFLVFVSIYKLFHAEDSANELMIFFDAGLMLGVAMLFNTTMLFYFVLTCIVLIINRQYHWRNWFVILLGFVLPYVFLSAYTLALHGVFIENQFVNIFNITQQFIIQKVDKYYVQFIVFIPLTIFALTLTIRKLKDKKIHVRKRTWMLIYIFIISVAGFILQEHSSSIFLLFASLSLGYFLMASSVKLLKIRNAVILVDIMCIALLVYRFVF
jgi:hypothetical protein